MKAAILGSVFALIVAIPPDAEIREILVDRVDMARQSVGIVVGIITPDGRRIVSYGGLDQAGPRPLNGDTIFEIGSNTKVFTSLLLAEMVERGELALTDPVAKYLPTDVKVPERGGRQMTLQDLSTHTSGLPRDPPDMNPKDLTRPYADCSVEQLYQFLWTYQLPRDIGSRFEYSNVGVALLGLALTRRAGMDYEALVQARITGPLAMYSTRISLTPEMQARSAVGHGYFRLAPVPSFDMAEVYAPAGALRSTANDMLTFLGAFLGYTETPLAPAMAAMVKVRRPTGQGALEAALGWGVLTLGGGEIISHNGGTTGAESEKNYFSKLLDEQVSFKTDSHGRAVELIHHEAGVAQRAKRIQ